MSTNASNLVLGSANLYVAPFGASEATITTLSSLGVAPSGAWTDLGATTDGVTLTVNQEFTELAVDQVVDVVGNRLTKRSFQISTNLAELTLANLQLAMNGGAVATGTGTSTFTPATATNADPTYQALIIDGTAPNGKPRRIIVRKALSTDNVEFVYKKDEQSVYSVTFTAHYVSGSTQPFIVVDAT